MDIYKTPDANTQKPQRQLKPINAIAYGLLVSIVLTLIVSFVEGIVFGIIIAITQGVEYITEDFMARNAVFLFIDLLVTSACLFYAGKITGRYAPQQELKFGLIVAGITLVIYWLIYSFLGSDKVNYPIWYEIASFAVIFIAILLGAKSVKSAENQQ
ncbi:MAG: hypothetical protein IPK77_14740 [Cellvibrio sp.]|nr:hypothetical protein [Cellvibrio sp.]